ncbi:MAG TPA: MopE-related protein [Polyangiaceae bacterium]|nr:MopE-related protein [Polyangiaceae bacterium]
MKTGVCWGAVAVCLTLVAGCSKDPAKPRATSPASAGSTSVEEPVCLLDADDDGFCALASYDPAKRDCNDGDPDQFPGAPEALNGADDNCDGQIDEGLSAACPLTLQAPANGCEKPVQLSVGNEHACVLADSGRVFCWGKNTSGVLGTPDVVNATLPVAVPGVAGATRLASGAGAVCALMGANAICWGSGSAFPFTVPLPPGTKQIALA